MSEELDTHRTELRKIYVNSSPRQRLRVALQRISNTDHEPNLLVTRVSAVEAVARSLLVHQLATSETTALTFYDIFRNTGPTALVEAYRLAKNGVPAVEVIGADQWELFGQAVSYRNLLVHECTYLGQDKTPALIGACKAVLNHLAAAAGLQGEG